MQVLRIALTIVVTIVWLVGYALAFYKGGDQPDGLNVLMALVLGWVLGGSTLDAVRRVRTERESEKKDDPRRD